MAPPAVPTTVTTGFDVVSSSSFQGPPVTVETEEDRSTRASTTSFAHHHYHHQQQQRAALMSRDKSYASSANLVSLGERTTSSTTTTTPSDDDGDDDATMSRFVYINTGSEEEAKKTSPGTQQKTPSMAMKRVASMPVFSDQSAGPVPGSQEMRDMFFVRQDAVNFNASYGTPVREVLEKQWAYHVECETCPHEWMLGGAAMKIQAAREKLAGYVNAQKQDLSLVENCTAATTAAVRAADMRAGDTVIHLSTAYGMVKNCLGHAAAAVGADVRELAVEFRGNATAPCSPGGAPLAAALAAALDDAASRKSRVALVTFDYIASCPGALMPIHAMARECKARGVPVLLDGAHVLGQIRLDCAALEASGVTYFMITAPYLTADAHKWLFSPKGSAMLWVARGAQANCYPSVVGAVCSNSPSTNFNPAVLAGLSEYERRFQYTGTRDYTPLIAVHDALLFREKIGESAILGYNRGMAVWAQEWLAAVWRTETLVPAECTAFMAHARVPLKSPAAALLMNRMLKEDCSMHVMAFSLPARKHLGESEPTHWVRPCIQLFVHREDIRALGASVLRLAVGVEAAAKFGSHWLAKTRETTATKRATLEAEAANFLDATAAHKVTVGFSVPPPAFARQDSASDLTQQRSGFAGGGFFKTTDVEDASVGAGAAGRPGESLSAGDGAGAGAGGGVAAAVAVAKYSAAQQTHAPQLGHTAPAPPSFVLPALPEDREESAAEVADSFQEVTLAGSFNRSRGLDVNFNLGNGVGVKGGEAGGAGGAGGAVKGGTFARSPMSIMDLGSSVASSMGTSVDGAGFMHPDWFNRDRQTTTTPGMGATATAQQQPGEGF